MRLTRYVLAAVLALASSAAGQPGEPETREAIEAARSLGRAFKHAAEIAGPSVVHISTFDTVNLVQRGFFGEMRSLGTRRQQTGLGTGIIIDSQGHIVTNNHVVGRNSEFMVKLQDGRVLEARLVGRDPAIDIAVLDVNAEDLTPAQFGDSDSLEIGEWVVAIGNPFGFDNTVTAGIVSAMGRTGLSRSMGEHYEEYIQTDAAVNPGNSGGPLLNLDGHVVGINTQIASTSGGYDGLSFAIPANFVKPVADMIISQGYVQRGWLGVGLPEKALSVAEAQRLGIPVYSTEGGGVPITSVSERAPAGNAGLRAGDVVIRFNGRPTPTVNRLRNAIAFTPPDSEVTIEYVRDGRVRTARAVLVDQIEGPARAMNATILRQIGLAVAPLPEDLDPTLKRARVEGVYVVSVYPGTPADEAGFAAADIIQGVGRTPTPTPRDFERAVSNLDLRNPHVFSVIRYENGWRQGRITLGG
jgi:serine protease Do